MIGKLSSPNKLGSHLAATFPTCIFSHVVRVPQAVAVLVEVFVLVVSATGTHFVGLAGRCTVRIVDVLAV